MKDTLLVFGVITTCVAFAQGWKAVAAWYLLFGIAYLVVLIPELYRRFGK